MGVQDASLLFGFKVSTTTYPLRDHVQVTNASAAVEASGVIFNALARALQRNSGRAEELARHIYTCRLDIIPWDLCELVLSSFMTEMEMLRGFFPGGFLVVFEGPSFPPKAKTPAERRQGIQKAH